MLNGLEAISLTSEEERALLVLHRDLDFYAAVSGSG